MREPGLLKPAVLWLLLLAPLFFSTYGFATWVTSQRSDVGTLVFDWEAHMPFWAWTIVPYWSIDLLYGFSLLLPNSRHELKQHALRLLSAQVIAVSCFLVWPLRFTFERPELDGVFGWLFAHVALNVASMIGIIPLTGITLPLLSFGGTSMLFITGAMGLAFQLSRYTYHQPVSITQEADRENSSGRRGLRRTRIASRRGI